MEGGAYKQKGRNIDWVWYSVGKSLLSRLVQELSSYVIPGLRYEIIDTVRYTICELI